MLFEKRLLRLARRRWLALGLAIGSGFAAGVLTVWQASLLSQVISRVFLQGAGLAEVTPALAWILLAIGLRAGCAWASEVAGGSLARRIKDELRQALFERILADGPAAARGERSGELTSVLIEGIEALEAYFSQYLPGLALAALVPLTCLVFIFPLDPLSAAILLVTAPLIPLFMVLIGSAAQALTRRQWQTLSRLSAYFLDVLQGLATLKLFGRSQAQAKTIATQSERFRQATMDVLRVAFLSALALEMLATISTALVAVQIGLRLLYGRMSFEAALFVLLLAPEFYQPLRQLGARFHAGMAGVAAAQRIFDILGGGAAAPTAPVPSHPAAAPAGPPAIRFEQVHYTYHLGDEQRPALHGASFAIPAGGRTALVGASGAGKSTVASLLLRFGQPQQGRITVNGRELGQIPPAEWLAQVSWAPQRAYLFNDSALNNIRLGRPQASLEQVVQAARLAEAHEFIQALPQGYDTPLGEGGARLSGGQAQRIALARAFLQDAPFVILDEATANLDLENEARLGVALERLLGGRTALIIAHRLETVLAADQVVVMAGGQIVEQGAPADLLRGDGPFRRLAGADFNPPGGSGGDEPPRRSPRPAAPALPAGEAAPAPAAAPGQGGGSAWAALRRLLGFLAPLKGRVALSALLGAATVLSGVGLMSASAYLISAAALRPSIAELQVAIVAVRAFGIARGGLRYAERYVSHDTTFRLLARLRVWFYQALEPLAPARLQDQRSGDLLARILGDIETLEGFYVRAAAPPLAALLAGAAAGWLLWRFAPALMGAWLVCYLCACLLLPLGMRRLGRATGRRLAERRATLSAALVDGIQGLPDLLAFGQGRRWAAQIEGAGQALATAQQQMAGLNGLQSGLALLLANLGLWSVTLLAIPLVRSGQLDGVYIAAAALAALASFEAAAPLPLATQHLEANLRAAGRLFELADARPEVREPAQPQPLPEASGLQIRGLSFRYPGAGPAEPPALDGLDLDLAAGKKVALVGPSGAGKSTLVGLLARFWEYEQGEIRLGGGELRQLPQATVRQRLAVAPQNPYLFNASLGDNLRLAYPAASDAQIETALRLAGLGGWLERLPQGLETWAGEQGLRLSGGERQRLAVARALLRPAPLMVLDEPTAHLDPPAAAALLETLCAQAEGRALLLITHRLAGLERMDEILVLDGGRVVERGGHAELLRGGGLYRRWWEMEAAGTAGR